MPTRTKKPRNALGVDPVTGRPYFWWPPGYRASVTSPAPGDIRAGWHRGGGLTPNGPSRSPAAQLFSYVADDDPDGWAVLASVWPSMAQSTRRAFRDHYVHRTGRALKDDAAARGYLTLR